MTAPIILFVYSRPEHLRRTIIALQKNPEAAVSPLIIFSDGAKSSKDVAPVSKVRQYISKITGFASVTIYHREKNFGLAKSIIEGVNQVLEEYESAIILEDDMVTSPHFLDYMNEGLEKFAHDERVISVHGYMYPVNERLSGASFLRGADCWGWATWRRGWALFNPDGAFLLRELKRKGMIDAFDFYGAYDYSGMLKKQIKGVNNSWAIRWYASAFLANKLTLYPDVSLVQNIGNDSSGTHCKINAGFDVTLSQRSIDISEVNVVHSAETARVVECFFRKQKSPYQRIYSHFSLIEVEIRDIAKNWFPPALIKLIKRLFKLEAIRFEGPVENWSIAKQKTEGYDSREILKQALTAAKKVKNGQAVFERDSVIFNEIQYSWPVTAGLMQAAALNDGHLNVLDFGGSLGSAYFQNRKFFEKLKEVRWSIVEQPHVADAGQKYIQTDNLRFFESIDDCIKTESPSVILLSSVLQYVEHPYAILEALTKTTATMMIIDRTPYTYEASNSLWIQHVSPRIYSASYPMHVFSETEFLEKIVKNWSITADYTSPEGHIKSSAGNFVFKGYMLARNNS